MKILPSHWDSGQAHFNQSLATLEGSRLHPQPHLSSLRQFIPQLLITDSLLHFLGENSSVLVLEDKKNSFFLKELPLSATFPPSFASESLWDQNHEHRASQEPQGFH